MSGFGHVGEHDGEPIAGLPELLPEGERILWQGAPHWRTLARRALHTGKLAVYFAALVVWVVGAALAGGGTLTDAAAAAALPVALATGTVALLAFVAWLNARATLYTITNRRVVMRFGVAIELAVNLPFRTIQSAELRRFADGTGDLALVASGVEQLGYGMLWPHARPWRLGARCQPMLRSIPDAEHVADLLGRALQEPVAEAAPQRDAGAGAGCAAPPAAAGAAG